MIPQYHSGPVGVVQHPTGLIVLGPWRVVFCAQRVLWGSRGQHLHSGGGVMLTLAVIGENSCLSCPCQTLSVSHAMQAPPPARLKAGNLGVRQGPHGSSRSTAQWSALNLLVGQRTARRAEAFPGWTQSPVDVWHLGAAPGRWLAASAGSVRRPALISSRLLGGATSSQSLGVPRQAARRRRQLQRKKQSW